MARSKKPQNQLGGAELLQFLPPGRRQEILNEAVGSKVRDIFQRNHQNTLGGLVAALTGDAHWSVLQNVSVSVVLQPAAAGRGGGSTTRQKTAVSSGKVGRPRGRRSKLNESTLAEILTAVEKNPNLRSEQLQKKLEHLGPKLVKQGLAKLRSDKRVKTSGERRATTYTAAK